MCTLDMNQMGWLSYVVNMVELRGLNLESHTGVIVPICLVHHVMLWIMVTVGFIQVHQ